MSSCWTRRDRAAPSDVRTAISRDRTEARARLEAATFAHTINNSGFSGSNFSSPVFWFVVGIGLLMAQYTYTGYDASAHMSEETHDASRSAARANSLFASR